jgi:hypothetical protein
MGQVPLLVDLISGIVNLDVGFRPTREQDAAFQPSSRRGP